MWKKIMEAMERYRVWRRMEQSGQIGTRKRRTDSVWSHEADRSLYLIVALVLLLWAVCIMLLILPGDRQHPQLVQQQLAPATIFARVDFSYENTTATEAERQKIMDAQVCYLRISAERNARILSNVDALFEAVRKREAMEIAGNVYQAPDTAVKQELAALSPSAFRLLLHIEHDSFLVEQFRSEVQELLKSGILNPASIPDYQETQQASIIDLKERNLNRKPLRAITTMAEAEQYLTNLILSYRPEENIIKLDQEALQRMIKVLLDNEGNLERDILYAEKKMKETLATVQPVMIDVKKNEVIVHRNELVTQQVLESLQAEEQILELHRKEIDTIQNILYKSFWSLLLILFGALYMHRVHPEITSSSSNVALVVTIAILSLGLNYCCVDFFYFISSVLAIPPGLVQEIVPLALASALLSVMLGYRVALCTGFFVAMVSALILDNSFYIALEGLALTALVGMLVRNSANYRTYFLRTCGSVFLVVWLLDFNLFWQAFHAPVLLLQSAILALGNALLTAIVSMLLTFLFEILFNVSTNMSLMVLCDYNHPVLKELHLRAPGTSQHSQNVAMLAENATSEIGGNAICARAGALFHDIGKMKNPEYFTENNLSGSNPHDKLTPRMSSIIIRNHVKDGLDLALQYKLCKVVRDAIQQHHGTDLIQYFYHKAQQEDVPILESDYRYPGPLAHHKETVIVSLADACEAACRSLEKPTASKIETTVEEIFRKRWRDGQLDDAELTIAELSRVKLSFIRTLTTMYHSRIAYPKDEMNDEDDLRMEERQAPMSEPKTAP